MIASLPNDRRIVTAETSAFRYVRRAGTCIVSAAVLVVLVWCTAATAHSQPTPTTAPTNSSPAPISTPPPSGVIALAPPSTIVQPTVIVPSTGPGWPGHWLPVLFAGLVSALVAAFVAWYGNRQAESRWRRDAS